MSDNITRLARVLGMMGSTHDGEVLNAARMAEKIRREIDKPWGTLLTITNSAPNDNHWMLRAIRAESRCLAAEGRAADLASRLSVLETEMAGLRGDLERAKRSDKTRRKTAADTNIDPRLESDLCDRLSRRSWSTADVRNLMNWHGPMNIRLRLAEIAKRHGYVLSQFGRGQYRFRRPYAD